MAKVLALVVSLLAAASAAPSTKIILPSTPNAIVPTLDGRIIGGSTTTINSYPYQVSLLYYSSHICGGSLIATNWVLTAAHCTSGSSASVLSVRVGSSYRTSGGTIISISTLIQHGSFSSSTLDYDISALRLASSVSTGSTIGIIGLTSSAPAAGVTSTITGWGTTSEGGSAASQLQVVQVPIVSSATCGSAYGTSAITARMLCAGLTAGGRDACQGDSGGPLVTGGTLSGIVSWGYGCARPNYPGVYASVPGLRSWISSNTGV